MTEARRAHDPGAGNTAALVVGLGSLDRGDDAVGPAVARAVGALALPGVRVVEHEDPTSLIELWSTYDVAVVVDAVRSGAQPGTIHVFEATDGVAAWHASASKGSAGTHTFGVVSAVELSRALQRLPRRLVLVAVEAAGLDHGAPLSLPVAAAVEKAVDVVVHLLRPEQTPSQAGAGAHVPR